MGMSTLAKEKLIKSGVLTTTFKVAERSITMSKKDKDIALFVAFCIEEYGAAKGMTGEQVLDLFSQYGVTDYLSKCFEPLHTQGREWLIDEIDEFIEIRKNTEA